MKTRNRTREIVMYNTKSLNRHFMTVDERLAIITDDGNGNEYKLKEIRHGHNGVTFVTDSDVFFSQHAQIRNSYDDRALEAKASRHVCFQR